LFQPQRRQEKSREKTLRLSAPWRFNCLNRSDAKKNLEKKTLRLSAPLLFNCFNRRDAKKNQEKKLCASLRLCG
jgi:hypothetical protein